MKEISQPLTSDDMISSTGCPVITVSFDGTWHKKGPLISGIGTVIDFETGLAIDTEVLYYYCVFAIQTQLNQTLMPQSICAKKTSVAQQMQWRPHQHRKNFLALWYQKTYLWYKESSKSAGPMF